MRLLLENNARAQPIKHPFLFLTKAIKTHILSNILKLYHLNHVNLFIKNKSVMHASERGPLRFWTFIDIDENNQRIIKKQERICDLFFFNHKMSALINSDTWGVISNWTNTSNKRTSKLTSPFKVPPLVCCITLLEIKKCNNSVGTRISCGGVTWLGTQNIHQPLKRIKMADYWKAKIVRYTWLVHFSKNVNKFENYTLFWMQMYV